MPADVAIRPARPHEADTLTALAMRSKAHWGYDAEFLERVRPMLTFTEADVSRSLICVLEAGGAVMGLYRVSGTPPVGELEDLWLDPELIGEGMGRRLFEHALRTASERGFSSLLIESDPNALGFYLAMGATRIGDRRSPSGRSLPLLRIDARGRTGSPPFR